MNDSNSSKLAKAARVLSIIALLTFCIFYISIPLAAIAIILALLSRGKAKISSRGRTTIILSAAAILLSAFTTISAVYTVFHTPELKKELEWWMDYYFDSQEGSDIYDWYDRGDEEPDILKDFEHNDILPELDEKGGQQI